MRKGHTHLYQHRDGGANARLQDGACFKDNAFDDDEALLCSAVASLLSCLCVPKSRILKAKESSKQAGGLQFRLGCSRRIESNIISMRMTEGALCALRPLVVLQTSSKDVSRLHGFRFKAWGYDKTVDRPEQQLVLVPRTRPNEWKHTKCFVFAREGASSGGGLFASSGGASSGALSGGEATRKGSEQDVRYGHTANAEFFN